MNTSFYTDEEKLLREAIQVLMEKLGPLDTFRFLSLNQGKQIDSVKKHRLWQASLNKKEFFDEVFKEQQ